ncbi:penicillin acylase family protein [Algoriphagus sediminis]|uniref:Penicillin acylase family protein n=1 Tax=Algoriphagus sediminis TaxID=3057113 RepID=A0ABT7YDM8_9BACT|nr:penicillin acylase family protein [Algoriphagus sediminis]MDN3204616.1 penicillin acylase family protein [Algoriphagus sediminis]
MRKVLIVLGSLFLIAIFALLCVITTHTPKYDGDLDLIGLENPVEVLFDNYGVPHIYAENELDAYRAFGYVHAQDRLFQLEMMRRVGTGTLSEFLGNSLLDTDKFFRTLGISKQATISTDFWNNQANSPIKEATNAYIDGVNQFIREGNLPIEYVLLGEKPREFTVNDIHAITGYMAFSFAMAVKTDPILTKIQRKLGNDYLKSLSINTLPDHVTIPNFYPPSLSDSNQTSGNLQAMLKKLPVPLLKGSNAWVISGDKTESGKVIFANDTHIGFSSPSVWYEAHLEYPGHSYYGNHLAGMPFGLVGHSDFQSIGLTMFENDDQDFFEEKLNPNNPNEILIGNNTSPIRSRIEIIKVKGEEDVEFEVKETIHGPIMNSVVPEIAELTNNPVSSWWVYLQEPSRALEATYRMNRAKSIDEVALAAELIHAPGLNIMYGDAEGNIAWWAAAKLPIRNKNSNSKFFRDGSDPAEQPTGWLPFSSNPQSINPMWGYVVSANNQTDTLSTGDYVPGYFYPGDRYDRIAKTLEQRDNWTVEDLKELQNEVINLTHPKNAKLMLTAARLDEFPEFEGLFDEVQNWDGSHKIAEIAPTLYYKWLYHSFRMAMSDEVGQETFESFIQTFAMIRSTNLFLSDPENKWWDDVSTEGEEGKSDILTLALGQSLKELQAQHGNDWKKWYWEKSIVSEHPHPLGSQKPLDKIFNVKTEALQANAEAVNKLAFSLNGDGVYTVRSGPAMRILLDFSDVEGSISVLPTGQSGNRFSPHYKNQAKLYTRGEYRPQLMNRVEIENDSKDRLIFTPEN